VPRAGKPPVSAVAPLPESFRSAGFADEVAEVGDVEA
jgi:hypothetical protein